MSGVIMDFDSTDPTTHVTTDYLAAKPHYILALKVVTGVFSGLSLFGALTVIFFHVFLSRLWPSTIVRHIVVMLSIADLLVAISHIWGATQSLQKFTKASHPNGNNFSSTDIQCTAQAVLTVVGTLSSFMWTLALVSYVLTVTSLPGVVAVWCQKSAVVALYSVPCWGFPLVLTIVLARLYLLGYAESVDLGWCYVSFSTNTSSFSTNASSPKHLGLLLSYELWTWIIIGGIIICAIAYVVVHSCKKYCGLCSATKVAADTPPDEQETHGQVTAANRLEGADDQTLTLTSSISGDSGSTEELTTVGAPTNRRTQQTGINCRPVLAGVLLLGLHSLSTIVDATLMVNHGKYYHDDWLAYLALFAAIGDSLQGFVNMFLFVWCTPQVYTKCPCCRVHGKTKNEYQQIQ